MVVKMPPVSTKPWIPIASSKVPTIWPLSLIPEAWVPIAPGTLMVVKLPPVYKKPWFPTPTIWPLLLIPRAMVL
jgi:hypothetical protein